MVLSVSSVTTATAWRGHLEGIYSKIFNRRQWMIIWKVRKQDRIGFEYNDQLTMNNDLMYWWSGNSNLFANFDVGHLYGLEKFWAFLKFSNCKEPYHPAIAAWLSNYRTLEDFHAKVNFSSTLNFFTQLHLFIQALLFFRTFHKNGSKCVKFSFSTNFCWFCLYWLISCLNTMHVFNFPMHHLYFLYISKNITYALLFEI